MPSCPDGTRGAAGLAAQSFKANFCSFLLPRCFACFMLCFAVVWDLCVIWINLGMAYIVCLDSACTAEATASGQGWRE